MDGTGDTINCDTVDYATTGSEVGGGVIPVAVGTGPMDWRAHPLRGRGLRLILADELRRRPTTTVAELVAALRDQGFRVTGRASKVVSDALRWEITAGRVERLDRGVYRFLGDTRSHRRRSARFASFCRHWIVAVKRGQTPTPTPRGRLSTQWIWTSRPDTPPWWLIDWIWAT